jgi:alcohol dehydrogenase (NADP+)
MAAFQMAPDGIDPGRVPVRGLYTGARMPGIGLGTFGSDHASAQVVSGVVGEALRLGYRFIDCAACYGNEREIGAVLGEALDGGLPRSELFILSKLWNDRHAPEQVVLSCKKSIEDLRVGYLDCYLVHWPFPNDHEPGCAGDARNPASRPYIHEEFMATWRAMEDLVDRGLVRHIGTSNVTIPKLKLILRDARIKPAACEMELHPTFQQGELFQFCLDHDIAPIGYSPIGSPNRPERDRMPGDLSDLEMPVVKRIAGERGVHPAQICLKWAVQRGQTPIPFATRRENVLDNLKAVVSDPLKPAEMEAMRSCERNCRLIKGQVFLWEGANDWLDLWDVDGSIPGWNGYSIH